VATATIAPRSASAAGPLHHRRAGDQQLREVSGGAVLVVILALLVQIVFTGLRRLVVPAPCGAGAADS